MLSKGTAKKVTIYVNEDTQHHLVPLYESILAFLVHKGVSGATVTRALAGFGAHRVVHTPKIEVLAEHLPVRIEFIETAQKVDELLPTLYEMVSDGLMEVQDTTVVKIARKEKSHSVPTISARAPGRKSQTDANLHGRSGSLERRAAVRRHRQAAAHDGHLRRDGVSRNLGIWRQGPHAPAKPPAHQPRPASDDRRHRHRGKVESGSARPSRK